MERHRSATLVLLALIAGVVGLRAQPPPPAPTETPVYRLEVLPRSDEELLQRFSEAQVAILEKLNRRDREHLVRVEPPVPGLVVPDRWEEDDLRYSPLPAAYGGADEYPKLIVVHQPWQVFGAYEYGRLVRWGPVSTGRRQSPTPSGLFHLTWKAKSRRSTDNQAWLLPWYFNFVNARGVSFHQFDLPGSAASHACVRLLERDARWLYDWGDQWILDANGQTAFPGTPVHVLGEAQHGAMPIWTDVERLDEPIELAPIPERDRLLFQAAIERLSPRVDRIAGCATQRIEGEVADGDAFEAPIGRGLWLVLMSERDPQVSGWRLEIRGAPDRLDDDHVYPVSPPYRSVTPRDIGTMFGRSADEILEFRERPFNFVTTRADQHVAQREVRTYLWPSGLPPGADERAIVRLSLLKLGRGVLTILDGRKGTRLVNEPHEIVEWFRFRVDLCWP